MLVYTPLQICSGYLKLQVFLTRYVNLLPWIFDINHECLLYISNVHACPTQFMDVTNTRAPGLGVCALGYKISLLSADVLSQCVWLMASVAVLSHSTMPQQLKGQEASAV